ncbi:MAG: hypothetical protein EOO12_15485, partial [Chitinophagaceae bacterium]
MIRFPKLVLFLLAAQLASAQGADHLRQAERYYASGDYYNAAVQYEQYLGIRKSNSAGFTPYAPQRTGARMAAAAADKAYERLAECYFQLHDYAQAAQYYGKLNGASSDGAVNYVRSLRASGQKDSAFKALQAARVRPLTPAQQQTLALEEAALRFDSRPDPLVTVTKATGDLNTGHGNYAAVEWGGTVFFTSSRTDSSGKGKGPNRNHLYRVVGTDALNADPLPGQDIDQGLCSLTPDGKRIYFSAWTREGGRNVSRIYTVTREDGGWTTPVLLNEKINAPGSSNAQPFYVEKEGTRYLLFSSDRAGGQGGYDLWFAVLNENISSLEPQNLGAGVNSAGDEQAPFYQAAAQTLVFASNGRPGLGGFDLFASKGTLQGFGAAENLGAPYNSVKDDSYFFSVSADSSLFRKAYLSSDRASDCCLEIYTIAKQDPPPPVDIPPAPMPKDTAGIVEAPVYTLPLLLFDFDKAELTAEARQQLDTVFLQMSANPARRLRIGGYTDGKGRDSYN